MLQSFVIIIYSLISRIITMLSSFLGIGSGTSVSGIIAEKYFPQCVRYFRGKYKKIIYITGTNGKTTTRSIFAHILDKEGISYCTNRGGANIFRGIVTSLLGDISLIGKVQSDYLVLEVEEATLPKLSHFLPPDILVLTNIFRDQLDAYGEIDSTLNFFTSTITNHDPLIVINTDDQLLTSTISKYTHKLYGFGVQSDTIIDFEESSQSSNKTIKNNLIIKRTSNGEITLHPHSNLHKIYTAFTQLEGDYNLYNIAGAIQLGSLIFDQYDYIQHISTYTPAFGRGEKINIGNRMLHLYLVKNPAGYNAVLSLLNSKNKNTQFDLVCALNDNIADGKDVSWIWDISIEKYLRTLSPSTITTLGTRKYDMALRLHYAGIDITESAIQNSIRDTINQRTKTNEIYILATYTSLLEIRRELSEMVPDMRKNINSKGN